MKKFLVVLTILVLVAGSVFADISGKVEASYKFAFATERADKSIVWGSNANYEKPGTGKVDASFTLDSQSAGLTGEGMPYVDLAVSAKIAGFYSYSSEHANTKNVKDLTKVTWTIKVAKFDIVGDGWKLNLLNAKGAALDLAVSAIDYETFNWYTPEQNDAYYTYANAFDYADGVTLSYKDFIVGVGFNSSDIRDRNAAITLEVATPEFTFDAVKVQAGAGFTQTGFVPAGDTVGEMVLVSKAATKGAKNVYWLAESDSAEVKIDANGYTYPAFPGVYYKITTKPGNLGGEKQFGGSVKVSYDADVKASVAIDLGKRSTDDKVKFDLAANLQVSPVTVDVYFVNEGVTVTDAKGVVNGGDPIALGYEKYLSARAIIALGDVIENVPVKLTITGTDLLNDDRAISVEANTTAVKDFDITVSANSILQKSDFNLAAEVVYTGIENLKIDAGVEYTFDAKLLAINVDTEYTAEKYTAKGGAFIATNFTDMIFGGDISVESDKLVNGATLKAEFDGFAVGNYSDKNYHVGVSTLILSCTVEF